jgi:hypothetical protein
MGMATKNRKTTGISGSAIEAGRVVSRKTSVDRRVVGFSGSQSSVRYKSSLERPLDAPPVTDASPRTSPPSCSNPAACSPPRPGSRTTFRCLTAFP